MTESLPPLETGGPKRGLLGMPELPVAGFRRRLIAMILDLLLATLAIRLISSVLSPVAIASGELWPYITGTLFFAYFVVFNGPLGATPGKRLLRLRVTDQDGGPASLRQSLIRTAVLFPIFPLTPIAWALIGDSSDIISSYWRQVLSFFPFVAVILATVLVIPFNPFKQGIHDYLSKTLVRPVSDEPHPSLEEMAEVVGNQWTRFHRQPQISGGVTIALIFSMLCFLMSPSRYPAEYVEFLEAQSSLNQIPGFAQTAITSMPYEKRFYLDRAEFGPFRGDIGEEMKLKGPSDEFTSGTISLVAEVTRRGKWTFDPLQPNSLPYVEQMADRYYKTVLPFTLMVKATHPHPPEQELAQVWNTSPVEMNFVFLTAVNSAPPVFTYREPVATFTKVFPALNLDLPAPSPRGSN